MTSSQTNGLQVKDDDDNFDSDEEDFDYSESASDKDDDDDDDNDDDVDDVATTPASTIPECKLKKVIAQLLNQLKNLCVAIAKKKTLAAGELAVERVVPIPPGQGVVVVVDDQHSVRAEQLKKVDCTQILKAWNQKGLSKLSLKQLQDLVSAGFRSGRLYPLEQRVAHL